MGVARSTPIRHAPPWMSRCGSSRSPATIPTPPGRRGGTERAQEAEDGEAHRHAEIADRVARAARLPDETDELTEDAGAAEEREESTPAPEALRDRAAEHEGDQVEDQPDGSTILRDERGDESPHLAVVADQAEVALQRR